MHTEFWLGKPLGKRPLGRPTHRWRENITTDRKAEDWEGVDWMALADNGNKWRTVVDAVMNLQVP